MNRSCLWLLVLGGLMAASFAGAVPEAGGAGAATASRTIEPGQATRVEVEVNMGMGVLGLGGGSAGLCEATFEVPDTTWLPEIGYEEGEGEGRLEINGPESAEVEGSSREDANWDIRLSDEVVTDVEVGMGAGELVFRPAGMNLERCEVSIGVGELRIDLTGAEWKRSPDEAEFEIGVGDVVIVVPGDVGVSLELETGMGEVDIGELTETDEGWVNAMWGKSDVGIELAVEVGVGSISVETAGTGP